MHHEPPLVSENYMCHHIQCDLPTCGLVLQKDLSNRKVRSDESLFLAWLKKMRTRQDRGDGAELGVV